MNTGEYTDPIEEIDLNSLKFSKMKKPDFKLILGKLGLETIGTKPILESRLKSYIKMKKPEKESFLDGVNENDSDVSDNEDSDDELEFRPPKRQRSPSRDSRSRSPNAIGK